MEVFVPARRNGFGIVWVVSSGKFSLEQTLQESFERWIAPLLDHGYTVFAVIHGSAPIFNIQDQLSDVRRAGLMASDSESAIPRLDVCSR